MLFNSRKKLVALPLSIPFLLFLFLMALLPSDSAADTYRWVDADGIIHISDNPPDIPPAYRKNVQIVKEYQEQSKDTSIPFERTPSGLILVDAVLNGSVSTKMVFDTGADTVVITKKLARKLNQDIASEGEEIELHTNCGDISGQSFALNKIELGNVSKENVRSVIAPIESSLSGYDGLLGLSFLGDFKITVDYKKSKIMISREE
jgi:clan AA aspartic protease (TIGR02281 family)